MNSAFYNVTVHEVTVKSSVLRNGKNFPTRPYIIKRLQACTYSYHDCKDMVLPFILLRPPVILLPVSILLLSSQLLTTLLLCCLFLTCLQLAGWWRSGTSREEWLIHHNTGFYDCLIFPSINIILTILLLHFSPGGVSEVLHKLVVKD